MVSSINNFQQSPLTDSLQGNRQSPLTDKANLNQTSATQNSKAFDVVSQQNTVGKNPVQQLDNLATDNEKSFTSPRGNNLDILA